MSTTPAAAQKSDTPILDRQSPFPGPAKPSFWAQLPALIILISILYVLPGLLFFGRGPFFDSLRHWAVGNIHDLFSGDWAGVKLILTGFAIALACLAAVAVHEGAHLVTGLAMGFRFEFVHVGRTKFDRSFRPSRIPSPDGLRLGAVSFFPKEMKQRPLRCFFMIVAGPVANLIAGFAVLGLPFQKSFVSGAFILMCVFLGVMNLSPQTPDGKNLFTIVLRRADHEAGIALSQLREQIRAGVEYEALSPALLAEATTSKEKSSQTAVAHLIAYMSLYHQRNYEAAAASLENCFKWSPWVPVAIREGLIYSAAVIQAKRGRIDSAEHWYAALPPQTKLRHRLQVEGAILEAKGDLKATLKKIAECENEALREPGENHRELALKQLSKWKAEIEQRTTAISSPN